MYGLANSLFTPSRGKHEIHAIVTELATQKWQTIALFLRLNQFSVLERALGLFCNYKSTSLFKRAPNPCS